MIHVGWSRELVLCKYGYFAKSCYRVIMINYLCMLDNINAFLEIKTDRTRVYIKSW